MPRKQNTSSVNFNAALPSRLRTLLKDKDVTQQKLADYLGKTRQMISKYADGSCAPDWQTIIKIAEFFGVSTDYLLGLTDYTGHDTSLRDMCDYAKLSEKAVRQLRRLNGDARRLIAKIINDVSEYEEVLL